jgi:hypothetical protein
MIARFDAAAASIVVVTPCRAASLSNPAGPDDVARVVKQGAVGGDEPLDRHIAPELPQ